MVFVEGDTMAQGSAKHTSARATTTTTPPANATSCHLIQIVTTLRMCVFVRIYYRITSSFHDLCVLYPIGSYPIDCLWFC